MLCHDGLYLSALASTAKLLASIRAVIRIANEINLKNTSKTRLLNDLMLIDPAESNTGRIQTEMYSRYRSSVYLTPLTLSVT